MRKTRGKWVLVVLLPLSVLMEGCAAIALTLLGVGAGVSGGTGVSYTLDSIAYKSFTATLAEVRQGTTTALKRMGLPVENVNETSTGVDIQAKGSNEENPLDIEIELDRLSPLTTRMRVVAKRGTFMKDRATATEIILQTVKVMDERERVKPPAKIPSVNGKGGK